jgi:hypothetical protein
MITTTRDENVVVNFPNFITNHPIFSNKIMLVFNDSKAAIYLFRN